MTLLIRKKRWLTALLVLVAMLLPSAAFAHDGKGETATASEETPEPEETPAPTVTSVVSTLPVLGSGLNITIGRDETGALTSVALDPSDGSTITKETDHKVVFLLGDGDTEVVVKSTRGVVQTKVKANDPDEVSGDGSWVGDVFGTGVVTIPYAVSFDADLIPTIAVGAVTGPADVIAEIGEGKSKASDDGDRAYYSIKVKLSSGDQDATLRLKAYAKVDEDGETRVAVSATLHSRNKVDCGFDRDDKDSDDRDRDRDRDDDDESEARGDGESIQARWDDDRDGDRDRRDRDDRDDRDRDDDDRDDDRSDRRQDRDDGDDS